MIPSSNGLLAQQGPHAYPPPLVSGKPAPPPLPKEICG
jgi:hypothetical protein